MSSHGFSLRLWMHRGKHKSTVRAGRKLRLQSTYKAVARTKCSIKLSLAGTIIVYA